MKRSVRRDKHAISTQLKDLMVMLFVYLCVLTFFLLAVSLFFSSKYAKVSDNITLASQFNQNFKDDVDLKVYFFVTGSEDELPLTEIAEAKALADSLLESTNNKNSLKAIKSARNLCDNLGKCLAEIEATDGYDQRMSQLENNIYIITELIQKYMKTYLYHEAGELAEIRHEVYRLFPLSLLALAAILAVIIFTSLRRSLKLSRSITQPIDRLYERVQEIADGDLQAKPPVQAEDAKLMALSTGLEEMVTKLNEQTALNNQEQEHLRSLELSLLQAQINPHFLYNTLDAMIWLIETGNNDQAVEMVSSLSTYFRSFLSNGKDIITLQEDVLHVKSYLQIQQMRYKDVLNYKIKLTPALGNCLIPKMTLQPLVENAIYHGIKPKRGSGIIRISDKLEDGYVHLTVSDTGMGMTPETLNRIQASMDTEEASSFGIYAAYQRLKLIFGDDFRFWIESTENVGTTVHIRIPYTVREEAIE